MIILLFHVWSRDLNFFNQTKYHVGSVARDITINEKLDIKSFFN